MAGLGCGSYNFRNSVNSGKSYSYIKFTESIHSALTEYIEKWASSNQQLSIVSEGSEGIISIPCGDGNRKFRFLPENAQVSFECLHQPTQSSDTLHSLGPFASSVRIQANDDSYEKTKKSMANVMAKNNKNSVKEHQPNGLMNRHRPTRPKLCAPPRKDNFASNHSSSHPTSHNGNAPSKTSPTSAITRPAPPPAKPTAAPRQALQNISSNKNIARQSLKQRIIQLLALGPMNKLQILYRLRVDGMKDADKKKFSNLLNTSAVLKDNTYHLHNHLWPEVQSDWPFYNDEEKVTLQNVLKSRGVSPNGRPGPNTSSPDIPQKRPQIDGSSESAPKRLKQNSPAPAPSSIPSPHFANNVKHRKAPKTKPDCVSLTKKNLSSSRYHGSSNSLNSTQSPSSASASSISPISQASPRVPPVNGHSAHPPPTSNGVSTSSYLPNHPPHVDKTNQGSQSDLMLKYDWDAYPFQNYPELENETERRRYKLEFDRIYKEYKPFHHEVESFRDNMEAQLDRLCSGSEDSREHKVARIKFLEKIAPSMDEFRRNLDIINAVEKVLSHLKQRVYVHDEKMMNRRRPS